jgi:hypothetical protein
MKRVVFYLFLFLDVSCSPESFEDEEPQITTDDFEVKYRVIKRGR